MTRKNKTSADGTAERLAALRSRLPALGVEAAIVCGTDDVHYFSGFTGSESWLVIAPSRQWLITDFRYIEEAEKTAPAFSTVMRKSGLEKFTAGFLDKRGFATVGYSGRRLTAEGFSLLRRFFPGGKWREIGDLVAELRSIKSPAEVAAIKKAIACSEAALAASSSRWKPGMSERDIKLDLEWEMLRRGADGPAFETIVACGPNSSLPHAHAGGGKLIAGRPLLVDFGARLGHYNSDMTRTFWIGEVPSRWRRRYESVLEAQEAAIGAICAGIPGKRPDRAARRVLAKRGWERLFGHGLGHGVGLEVHELPVMGKRADAELRPGQVVTVEPGLYFPGEGGIRIEDMALVKTNGCEVLGNYPKGVEAAVV